MTVEIEIFDRPNGARGYGDPELSRRRGEARRRAFPVLAAEFMEYYKVVLGEEWSLENAEARMADLEGLLFAFEKKKDGEYEPAGFIGAKSTIRPEGRVLTDTEVFVRGKYRGQKIGRELYKEFFAWARDKGIRTMEAVTYEDENGSPLGWYKRDFKGFEELGRQGDLTAFSVPTDALGGDRGEGALTSQREREEYRAYRLRRGFGPDIEGWVRLGGGT
jgi:GNAT superfamily N-acetyltransferase